MNAAASLHLGSCWINRAKEEFETPEGKALLKEWGLPEHLVASATASSAMATGRNRLPLRGNQISSNLLNK